MEPPESTLPGNDIGRVDIAPDVSICLHRNPLYLARQDKC